MPRSLRGSTDNSVGAVVIPGSSTRCDALPHNPSSAMSDPTQHYVAPAFDPEDQVETVEFVFGVNRRQFVQVLGAGLVIAVSPLSSPAQTRPGSGQRRGDATTP